MVYNEVTQSDPPVQAAIGPTSGLAEYAPPTDDQLIVALIGASGDHKLAATRLNVSEQEVLLRLPHLNLDQLIEGVKVARVLQMFRMFTDVKNTVMRQLGELPPANAAKLMVDLADRFETVLNPPVHGGSGAQVQINNNMGSSENVEAARAQLASRIIQVTATRPADAAAERTEAGSDICAAVRLGDDGETGAIGAGNPVEYLDAAHGTRIRQDHDWRADSAPQG